MQGCTLLNVPDDPAYDPYNRPENQSAMMVTEATDVKAEDDFIVAPTVDSLVDYDNDEVSRKAEPESSVSKPIVYWQ